jgi:carboxyl-terminal processing protease
MTRRRAATVALLALAAIGPAALVGARAVAGAGSRQMAAFAEILALIEERHVPEADPKDVIYASVHGMLQTLDPHTNFLDDDAYREMREEQRGSFYGLGIVISKGGRYQPLRVVSPIANTPAARMGVRAWDVISHIRDERADVDVDTIGLTIQEAVKHLRGPRGTPVDITIDRPGLDEPLVFSVKRDAIRTPAVNQAFMLRPNTGYVHVANFTETTSAEVDDAMAELRDGGATRLILDLRGNPGGLLEQAIGVASRFLEPAELVVYTEGRNPGSRQDYPAMRDVSRVEWPVVVIVDYGSASASEIVAGALQDHDRALLVGETTFGKGLVQSVYPLSESTGLALTTQKYYSPSGRTIQRPYEEEEQYYFEGRDRSESPEPDPDAPLFTTATGRSIPGGGGIVPDIRFKAEDLPEIVGRLARVSAFSRFVTPLDAAARARYQADADALLEGFTAFLAEAEPAIESEAVRDARTEVTLQLLAELALSEGGMEARDRILLDRDPVILQALEAFGEAERLLAARQRHLSDRRASISQRSSPRR